MWILSLVATLKVQKSESGIKINSDEYKWNTTEKILEQFIKTSTAATTPRVNVFTLPSHKNKAFV